MAVAFFSLHDSTFEFIINRFEFRHNIHNSTIFISDKMDADFVDNLKRETWRQWFTSLIHMLEDKTPFEASKTSSGRHKIKELLDMYEGMKSGGSFMDLNVPKDWALWKLGISKYSDGETRFAEEERIFNNSAVEEPAAAPAGDMLKGSFTTESDIKSVTKGIRLCNYCAEPSKSTCSTCRSRYYCCRVSNYMI